MTTTQEQQPPTPDDAVDPTQRWPHIERYLRFDGDSAGSGFLHWSWRAEHELNPADRAAGYEEWAEFYEWRLTQRTDLAHDRVLRRLVTEWTDSMAYTCRRSAAWARGEDPGEWVSLTQRTPGLHAEGRAIVDN